MQPAYDPPIERRKRSNSLSASSAPSASLSNTRTRLKSLSSASLADLDRSLQALSDEEADTDAPEKPLLDREPRQKLNKTEQDAADAAADRAVQREGRQSKQQRIEQEPNYHATGDMEQFLAQVYDMTHTIDALDNDIDHIVSLRNQIVSLKPSVDVGQVSLQADLHALATLTTDSGKRIVSLETWLLQLHKWSKQVRKLIKEGKAGETVQEVGEIKFELANAKLDFAAAMERIREGAYKEQQKRERTRIWMARHIRSREPEIEDEDVKGLLKAAELGAADGVAESHVTSYAGLWALQNPFTELAELTNGMRFLHDELDREIVDQVTGKALPKRIIHVNGVYSRGSPKPSTQPSAKQAPSTSWFKRSVPGSNDQDKIRYIQAQDYASEKDLEYGFARQQHVDRLQFRKKMIIALLLVVIAALVLFISLAMMKIPSEQSGSLASVATFGLDVDHRSSSTFAWGQQDDETTTTVSTETASSVSTTASPTHSSISASVPRTSSTSAATSFSKSTLSAAAASISSSSIVWWTPEKTVLGATITQTMAPTPVIGVPVAGVPAVATAGGAGVGGVGI
ncbi:uncharacterized protein JCM15063_003197 [Sporobolomyces koalae]|uniref:uncharacterized protein n=1 Tax=Sporobolomyces koalae TaxID=500713 RepID=UPI00316C1DBE